MKATEYSFLVLGRSGFGRFVTAPTALAALQKLFLPHGFRDAIAVFRSDILRPGPESRLEAVLSGCDPDAVEKPSGPFTAFIGEPLKGAG